ncbi:MAG: fibronectin type III domain-containing protein [Lachnospiraceae bacterium]|nr:fibronectin type III domain-containing protein [Lachnospiraceae bacterium]
MKKSTVRKTICKSLGKLLFTTLLMGVYFFSNTTNAKAEYQKVEENQLPLSTMQIYRNMDSTFLKTFPFGTTYQASGMIELETAKQMIDATDIRLKEGRIVQTAGFYENGDGGGASYTLSATKAAGGIQLANGLYANIILDTKVIDGKKWGIINPKQLGAKGDGQEAENDAINSAIYLASDLAAKDNNIFRSIVYLPAGEYKCTDQIQLNASNVNFVGEGNKSVIFTDNDYRKDSGYYEFFFTIWGATDLYMADFLVEAREVNGYNYMRQMVFVDCNNVYTYRVNLNIPQETFSKDYYVDKQYSSLTYYSGNKNMTLDSCKLELMCSTYRGANLGILDFYSRGEENITIMNCQLHSDARDEQVGIFSSRQNKDASYIRNVYFVNNTMYSYQPLDKQAAGGWRTMCFTVAYNDSQNVSDIYIKGNHFIADLDSKFMTFGKGIESCVVENNMLDIRCTDNLGAFLFDSSVSDANRVLIQNNEIYLTYRDVENIGKAAISGGKATLKGNKIVSDTWLGNIGYLDGIYEDNTYINLGYLGALSNNLQQVNDNKLISYGMLEKVMYFNGDGSNQVVNFNENYVVDYRRVYENNNVWNHVAKVQGNLKELNFTGNTYLAPNKSYWTWTVDNPKVSEFVKGLFFHNAAVEKALCKDNILQGANIYATYGSTVNEITPDSELKSGDGMVNLEVSNNQTKDYTLNPGDGVCTSIQITKDGVVNTDIFTDQPSVSLGTIVKAGHLNEEGECIDEAVTNDKELVWYTSLDGIASVDNGVVTRKNYGQVTVYAVPTDGAQKKDAYALFGKCNIHFVKGFAAGINFEKDNITLQKTKKYKAVYEIEPVEKASQEVEWTSSDTNVATVSSIGVIEAVGVGEADIICSTLDGTNISKKIHVTVEPLTVKKITLNQSDWYDYQYEIDNDWANKGVEIGETIQLEVANYTPENAINKGIKKWVSTNEKVATVNEKGLVTAVDAGYCQIRAYSMDEKCYGACGVWVQPNKLKTEDISVSYTDSYIKLEWKPQENIQGYIIYCDKGDGNGYQQVSKITDCQTTKYEAYGTKVGWYVEPGKTYKYKIAPYLERWDSNYYSHRYETPSDEISVTTYSEAVITGFNTNGVESVGVAVGDTTRIAVYCSKKTLPSSFRSDNEEIFTVEDKAPDSDNYELEIKGIKEGMANLILKGEDSLGYEKKIPVLVYGFQKIKDNIQAEPLLKSIKVIWKIEDKENQDGFKVMYGLSLRMEEITLSMEQLSITTDENGDMYAAYTIGDLKNDKDYQVCVAPYKNVDNVTFPGPKSNKLKIHTPTYVSVDSITAENLHILKVGESKKITAIVETEAASEPNLVWIPYDSSVIQVTESGEENKTTGYAVVKALKTGVSKLSVVANDENNYQIDLKIAVVPEQVKKLAGTADRNSVSLGWEASEGATGYAIYRHDSKQNTWVNIAKVTDTSYVDSGLIADTEYQYKVSAYMSDKDEIYEGEHTNVLIMKTQKAPETEKSFIEKKIENFKISKNYTTKVKLSWTKEKEAQGYEIYQYKSKKWKRIATLKNASVKSTTIKKLKSGTSYKFRICAFKKENGKTIYTQFTTLKVMTKPSKVKMTKVSTGKKNITLRWKKIQASGYEIQCSTSKKFKRDVTKTIVKKSKKTATVKKLKNGKTYYVRIRAYSKVDGKKYYGTWSKVKKVDITDKK